MSDNPLINPAPLAQSVADMRSGIVSVSDIVRQFQERFTAIEPHIYAFVPEDDLFERLEREAAALEARYPDPALRPPVYGALLGVKDIFHADGFITRAGTALPPELFQGAEAAIVTRLKAAGALVVGKTVTTEFAYYEPGPTRNPYNTAHTPGGSSSGSAAAVAAGLVMLATGTQTVGSTIRPAAFCGIVGYKPSFDRIDTAGLITFSQSADHVGLFTQDVAGMRLAASVVVNDWREVSNTPKRPVLAVPDGPFLQQATALEAFEAHIARLQAAGYTVKRVAAFEDIETIDRLHTAMNAAELAQVHADWFRDYEALYRPRTAALIRKGQAIDSTTLETARANRLLLRERLHQQMNEHGIELWVCPAATGTAPEGIDFTGNPAMNLPWTHAGLPAVTIPAGAGADALPLGLQLVGAFNDDERVLVWAEDVGQVFG